MEPALKQRLVGAAVLVALAVIFLPMLIQGPAPDSAVNSVPLKMPAAPGEATPVRELPLVVPATPAAGSNAVTDMPAPGDEAPLPASPAAASTRSGPGTTSTAANAAPTTTAATTTAPAVAATLPAAPTVSATPSSATAATPTPAKPLPAGAGMGDYLVTLGSYASAANAQALVVRLRAARLPVSTRVVAVGSGSGHAVVLGPFADRAAAEQARLAALKVRGDLPARVVVADAAPPAAQAAPAKPVATAAKPATAPPAAAVTRPASIAQGFVVQLVAVADRAKADALRDQLRKAGITAYTEQVSSAHGVLSRVRAGPVATRVEAEQLQANIRQRFGIEGSLRPYP